MKTSLVYMRQSLILIGLLLASSVHGDEFSYDQLLPNVASISFLNDTIIIRTQGKRSWVGPTGDAAFYVDRKTRNVRSITLLEAEELTREATVKPMNIPIRHDTRTRLTSDGIPYKIRDESCYLGGGKPTSTISFNDIDIEIPMNSCSSFASLETTEDYLWIGTYVSGGYDWYIAEKLLAINRKTRELAGVVDTGSLGIVGVVRDPVTNDIWSVTANQITIVSSNLQHRYRMQFYHDFDVATGMPEMRLETGTHYSNPLAVIARHLPEERQADYYKTAKELSDSVVYNFSLYDFYMCCSLSTRTAKPLPTEFSALAPFVHAGADHALATRSGFFDYWQQLACRIDHPETKKLCAPK